MRHQTKPRPTTSWTWLLMLVIGAGVFGWYITYEARGVALSYESMQKEIDATYTAQIKKVDLGEQAIITVPDMSTLAANRPWMYVSKAAPLPSAYQPQDLVDVTLPRADESKSMKLRQDVQRAAKQLFAQADSDDFSLMVSSAYRSVSDQQTLYDAMKKSRGEAYAKTYVLTPGASEHHTGYSFDVTDASTACRKDSDECLMSPATIAWIAENAPQYGFIVRYPSGRESVTGISHEPWHLRYVGVSLAKKLTQADVTFDEFIEQIAPGRVTRQ